MTVAEYYRDLLLRRDAIMAECVGDAPTFALQITSHNALKEFEAIISVVSGPEKSIFLQASREYQYSLEAILYGNYRHAFSSLRLSLELFIAAIYFSAHQMKMHLWLLGHDDLMWGTINDADKGVYSHSFLRAFNPELGPYRAQYMGLATAVYRECSEYVHGNPGTHEDAGAGAEYDAVKMQHFHDKIASMKLCILFAFVTRYLRDLDNDARGTIEHLVLDAFGDIPEIQSQFGVAGA